MDCENNGSGSTAADTPDPRESTGSAPSERVKRVSDALAMAVTINDSLIGLSPAVTVTGQYLGSGLASQMGFFTAANQYQHQAMVGMAATTADICRLLSGSNSASSRKTGRAAEPVSEAIGEPPAEPASGTSVTTTLRTQSSRVQSEKDLNSAGACEAAGQAAEAALGKAEAAVQDTGF